MRLPCRPPPPLGLLGLLSSGLHVVAATEGHRAAAGVFPAKSRTLSPRPPHGRLLTLDVSLSLPTLPGTARRYLACTAARPRLAGRSPRPKG